MNVLGSPVPQLMLDSCDWRFMAEYLLMMVIGGNRSVDARLLLFVQDSINHRARRRYRHSTLERSDSPWSLIRSYSGFNSNTEYTIHFQGFDRDLKKEKNTRGKHIISNTYPYSTHTSQNPYIKCID